MILLAFDVGRKKTGVAIGNLLTGDARPLAVARGGRTEQLAAIGEHIRSWNPQKLIVGLPLHLDGEEHAMTKFCRAFAGLLQKQFSLSVEFADERLTTFCARSEIKNHPPPLAGGGKNSQCEFLGGGERAANSLKSFRKRGIANRFSASGGGGKTEVDAAAAGIILRGWLRGKGVRYSGHN